MTYITQYGSTVYIASDSLTHSILSWEFLCVFFLKKLSIFQKICLCPEKYATFVIISLERMVESVHITKNNFEKNIKIRAYSNEIRIISTSEHS